jgi:cytochrome c-type biogenesis protein CcmH
MRGSKMAGIIGYSSLVVSRIIESAGVWFLLGIFLVSSAAYAQAQGDMEEQVRQIASQLRCPVCQNLSVADSPSEIAVQMRDIIRERLKRGESGEAIKAYFISKYGEWVLLSPKPTGLNLIVWSLPFFGLIAGIGWASIFLRRWVRRERAPRSSLPMDSQIWEWLGRREKQELTSLGREKERVLEALEELDFDFRSGKLSEQDHEEMKRLYENRAIALFRSALEREAGTEKVVRQKRRATEEKMIRGWTIPVGGVLLMVGGVALGLLVARSIQPRDERGSITGGPLTGIQEVPAAANAGGELGARQKEEIASKPADVASLLRLGREAYQRQRYTEAIDDFKKVLALDPGQPEALTFMGLFMLQAGHFDQALNTIDRALKVQPQNPPALEIKGMILHKAKGDHRGAIRVWEQLLQNGGLSKEAEAVIGQRIAEARAAMEKAQDRER